MGLGELVRYTAPKHEARRGEVLFFFFLLKCLSTSASASLCFFGETVWAFRFDSSDDFLNESFGDVIVLT
jgi:hypothetical protein